MKEISIQEQLNQSKKRLTMTFIIILLAIIHVIFYHKPLEEISLLMWGFIAMSIFVVAYIIFDEVNDYQELKNKLLEEE